MPLDYAGAALGAAFGEGFADFRVVVKYVVDRAHLFKPILKHLESTLDRLAPTVIEIGRLSEQLTLPEVETKSLIEHMKKGENLVRKCSKISWWNYLFKVYYSPKLKELEDEIIRFCQVDLQVHKTRNGLRTLETVISISKRMGSFRVVETPTGSSHGVAGPRDLIVGLDMPIKELKTLLLKKEVQLLLLTAPGGCGKTTMVKMLCQDEEIKDAIDSLPQLLNHIGPDPILLILDDVWLGSESLPEKFKFDIPDYKILVTSRTAFPRFEFTYHLKPLNDGDAMTLFRHSASLNEGSSYIPPEEDIKKIVKGCAGFPLVLKVIGGSLCRQKAEVWHSRLMNWSDGQFFFNSETELLDNLQNSLEFPDDKVIFKNCFMDLGLFPEDQRIPAAVFIDMWAELYELDEDGNQAIANLQELSNRNLASLVMSRKDASEVNNYYNEDFVTQHDILKELAMYQSSQGLKEQRQRLIINISKNNPPKWWTEQKQQLFNARLLSISTDEFFLSNWCNIRAPKVEVLVLNFQTQNYTLPKFMEKMDELKVLIIDNYGFFHSEISNFQLLGSLPNLKRIRLEKVSISSLCKACVPLKTLKKISLFMCNIGKAFENCTIQVSDALPNLTEINIDYCNDLEELPVGLCDILHLKKLSITNCHKLFALPEEIGKLVNLEVLRLRSCTDLSKLPDSIRNLHKLSILDISDCLSIMKLPKHIGEMSNLKELNMKGCLRLRTQFPESIMDLKQLKLVVCDEERAKLWDPIKEFLSDLEVLVAEKDINLNWLPK
uniref:RPW8 domain-containing protein n=1 Tax=Quercus lobata TaxID=97700 RepID=A0A7N2M066_QUELO